MLSIDKAVLVVIDVQEKLFAVMDGKETLLENTRKLVEGMNVLGIPVLVTEQYPKGLGRTVPEIMRQLPDAGPIETQSFSCWGAPASADALKKLKRKQVLLAGIETHVCVYQTLSDLLSEGYDVRVLGDCVSSRTAGDKKTALHLIRDIGGYVMSLETALFELLRTAEHESFKEISRIVK
jgi:nicotinamidase-related amidase